MEDSHSNNVSCNILADNGNDIYLTSSTFNIISRNNASNSSNGIQITNLSSNNNISENTFMNDGVQVSLGSGYGNAMDGNVVNSKPLIFLEGVSGATVGEAGQVILVSCYNIKVENLNVSHTVVGVELFNTSNSEITSNNIKNNRNGIRALDSSFNNITANNITANTGSGIFLYSSPQNTVRENNITDNFHGTLLWESSQNKFYHNNFINNTYQESNIWSYQAIWHDGYPSGGNYWSDYIGVDINSGLYQNETGSDGIGDTAYIINTNEKDNYPLMNPFGTVPYPPPPTYYLTIAASTGGTTIPAPGIYPHRNGTNVRVYSLPDMGYQLDHWVLDGSSSGSASSIDIPMNQNHTITAVFAHVIHQLTITATIGGTTNPIPGTYAYSEGSSVTVHATPSSDYILSYWELDSVNVGATNPISVTMDSNHNLRAVFASTYSAVIRAVCNTEGLDVGVSIWMDGSPTGYSTPHTFAGLTGAHTFSVSSADPSGHPFKQWSTGVSSTTIPVTSGGTYTAYYEAASPPPYSVTIKAHCNAEAADVSVSVWIDGIPLIYYTPHTFAGLTGSHTFTISDYDTSSHPFSQWSTGATTNTISVSSGGTYTAYYEATPPPPYSVTIKAHCNTEGVDASVSVWIDSSTMCYTPHTFTNLHGTHTFTASLCDTSCHSFKQWNTGSTSLAITVSSGGTYIAYYQALPRTLTVSSAHDNPVPSIGPHTYTDGQSVTCSVSSTVTEGSTVWTCTGWSGTGSVPPSGSGTSISFTITRDSTITWDWQARQIGDLILVDFSPVQVVYGASVLVANKPAVFRATVQSTFSQVEPLPLRIRVTYSGGNSFDYDNSIGPNTKKEVFIPFDSSSLRQKGTFTWTALLDPDKAIIETNEGNNMATGSKTVIETKSLSILYVPLRAYNDAPLSRADLKRMQQYGDQYVLATFPISSVRSAISAPVVLDWGQCNIATLLTMLSVFDNVAKLSGYDRTVVILPYDNGYWLSHKILGFPSMDAAGWNPEAPPGNHWTICTVENTYYKAIPHELAHTYNRPGGSNEEYRANPPGNPASGYDPGRNVDVKNALCIMSSTRPLIELGDQIPDYPGGYWICNGCYEALLGQFKKAGDPAVLYMGGVIFENDTALLSTWSMTPFGIPELPLGNTGNLEIVFLDDSHTVISQTGLNSSFVYFSDEYYITAFSFGVEYPDTTKRVQLWLDGNLIVEKNVTSNPPIVSVSNPNGGEILTAGETCLVSWNCSDLDGDELTSTVLYSGDGGIHWVPIAMDLSQTNFIWDTSGLSRGSEFLLKVVTSDGINIGEDVSNGTFTIRIHDITPSIIVPAKSTIGQNYSLFLNVTIENLGDFQETLNLTIYANDTVIDWMNNITLDSGSLTVCFVWDTTGFALGKYTISAYAWPVPGETDTLNNGKTCQTVTITIQGDINADEVVDIFDIATVALAFSSTPSDPNWNPIADINSDGNVNIFDIVVVAVHFGETG